MFGTTKLLVALVAITLATFTMVHYASHREVTDASTLSIRTIGAMEDTKSYRFNISTDLSIPTQEQSIDTLRGEGCVDYRNKKMRTTMTMMNRSVEMIVIGDTAYMRESGGSWQTQELGGYYASIWEGDSDVLAQQRSIMFNATNATMRKEGDCWVLDIIPDRGEVIKQMKKRGTGLETVREDELKNFTIRYWIETDGYHITRIENNVELEMNIKGLVTPMELNSIVYLDSYNERMKKDAPI
jgi:hypothetical protein